MAVIFYHLKVGYPAWSVARCCQADSKTSLIVKYIQSGDLGAKYGGNIIDYELRPRAQG